MTHKVCGQSFLRFAFIRTHKGVLLIFLSVILRRRRFCRIGNTTHYFQEIPFGKAQNKFTPSKPPSAVLSFLANFNSCPFFVPICAPFSLFDFIRKRI